MIDLSQIRDPPNTKEMTPEVQIAQDEANRLRGIIDAQRTFGCCAYTVSCRESG